MADLRTLPEHAHETFQMGDWVRVVDPELGADVKLRVIRRRHNVFQPWQCQVDVGDPRENSLVDQLARIRQATDFVRRALLGNPGARYLARGFIDAFSTQINTARGKLVWSGDVLEAIEVDAGGTPTGKRVRITPGGIGISEDGGQTYRTAMTGAGILANTVIVSELYALATDDGLTRLAGDGLHVYDRNLVERLVAGRWLEDTVEHFGLRVKAQDGQTVLLDDRGLLQTWQEGRCDNVDSTHPLVLSVYLPTETRSIRKALLRLRLHKFRAYETGAASGGGAVVTSQSGGGQTSSSVDYMLPGYWLPPDWMDLEGSHSHSASSGSALTSGTGRTYGASDGSGHYHDFDISQLGHSHSISIGSAGAHAHGRDVKHSHGLPAHTHDVNLPDHAHGLVFGIYEGTVAQSVTIKINGVDRTAALGGPFNVDQPGLDIGIYLLPGQWNVVELGSSQLGRIDATVFIQALLGV